jgi:uncharacterized glyoxalase superfamily protein PhnB
MKVKEITPVVVVDAIEPSLDLWTRQLGFQKVAEVAHEGALGFVMLLRDGRPLMLQTRASVAADSAAVSQALGARGVALYVDVDSIEAALEATKGVPHLMELRDTFYGAREFAIQDASGQVVVFAEHRGK